MASDSLDDDLRRPRGAPEISIVVPLRNEEGNVAPLWREIFAALGNQGRAIELVLVDDASTDQTWQRMLELRRSDPRTRAVRHSRRGGQSAALWTGLRTSRAPIIATLDGDLQNDPADLPGMLAELEAGWDLVCGARTKRQDNALRRLSSAVARAARKLVLGVDFRDTGCNLRVFKRAVLEKVPPFDGFHRFMPVLVEGAGLKVKEVPVNHRPRISGQTKYGLWNRLGRGIRDLLMVRLYRKRQLRDIPIEEPGAEPNLEDTERPRDH